MSRERHMRRRRSNDPGSGDFAAARIDLTSPEDVKYAGAVLGASKAASRNAWDWHDKIGEIHYAVGRGARLGGYARLRVHKLEPDGSIGDEVTSGLAGDIGNMLYSPYGGSRGLMERYLTLAKVPADSYLIECRDSGGNPDGIDFLSADEIKTDGTISGAMGLSQGASIQRITLPAGSRYGEDRLEERVSAADFIGRVWRPSSRFVDLADSPLTALDTTCELLHLLTLGIRSKLLSRLASNGIMYVPSEVNDARSAAPSGEPNEFHQNKVLNELIKAAVYSASHHGEATAALPIFMSGPGQHAEQFRHIVMDQGVFETDMAMRAELISRILQGLDIQPSSVTGPEKSSHWNAWATSDDELRVSIQPDIETCCWALTRLFLWRKMQEAGRKPGEIRKHVIWYDMSEATAHINLAEDVRQLRDRLLVNGKATRRGSGVPEVDALEGEEYIRALGVRIGDPYLATYGMPEAAKFDWEKIGSKKTGPVPDSTAPESKTGPGKGTPGSPADNKSDTPARLRPA